MTSAAKELTIPTPERQKKALWLAFGLIAAVIIADQTLKIWVKTHFFLGEGVELTPWWVIKFIENNGMAFGLELWNKIALTIGRIVAVIFLGWALVCVCRRVRASFGLIVCIALITAGAAGNIFDCIFYGVIFNDPMPPAVADFLPYGGGYAGWFEGRVVDMLYFPICSWTWPSWMPFVGGEEFEFFQYIFNIADSSICIGVGLLIFFYSSDATKAYETIKVQRKENAQDDGLK